MDQILTVENLFGKAWECQVEICHIVSYFQSGCDSVRRDKLCEIMKFWGIPNKFYKVNKSNNLSYCIKIGPMINDGFKVGNGSKQRDGLTPNLFNIALKCVTKWLSVQVKSTVFYISLQLIGYADDINIMG